jgi:hypothetical protein
MLAGLATEPVFANPPADVLEELRTLSAGLDEEVPTKQLDRNLLIGTWNIRAFADLTDKWRSGSGDTPKRDLAMSARLPRSFRASTSSRSKKHVPTCEPCATR